MQITNVRIVKKCDDPDKLLKAIVSVTIDNMLAIHDIRLIQTDEKMFIAMPNKKVGETTFMDVIHPINAQCRNLLTEAVISAYQQHMDEQREQLDSNN